MAYVNPASRPSTRAEQSALFELLVRANSPAAVFGVEHAIPFHPMFLEVRNAQRSAEQVAHSLAQRMDFAAANSLANWLRVVAHELDQRVAAEQVRRTRELAMEQERQQKLRKAHRGESRRLDAEAQVTETTSADALKTLEELIG